MNAYKDVCALPHNVLVHTDSYTLFRLNMHTINCLLFENRKCIQNYV